MRRAKSLSLVIGSRTWQAAFPAREGKWKSYMLLDGFLSISERQ